MPRDGHTGILHNGMMIVFGGDRHHMPFNDMFALDMQAEFERQAFQFVRDNNSRTDLNPSSMEAIPITTNLEEQQLRSEVDQQQQPDEENEE